ncbi:MAG TPA: transglutaminase family protein [Burkholderiaceae bacterium]|nr:transglutaminase family protein [Burkholderiaceae bacterium]
MIRLELVLELKYEVLGQDGADFIFNVHAAKTAHQVVRSERLTMSQPVAPQIATDRATGARFMRMHAEKGPLSLQYEATLDLVHHRADPRTLKEVDMTNLPLDVMQFVYPSRYCQSDRLFNFAFREFGALRKGYERVFGIQQWVQDHVRFESNTSDSSTSALDTLISGVGVCRDFTHLFIALCRALNIPARVATGTDYGADPALGPPDLHAYAEVYLSDRWYLFDPSGTSVPMGFMRFGAGRDAADVAFATMFGRVQVGPPRIAIRALEGPGLELPIRCEEALSTAALEQMGTDRGAFDGPPEREAVLRSVLLAH